MEKFDLGIYVKWRGHDVLIVSRCYSGGEWLYGVRLKSGKVVDYVPHRMLSASE